MPVTLNADSTARKITIISQIISMRSAKTKGWILSVLNILIMIT